MTLPIKITDLALDKLIAARKTENLDESHGVRIAVKGGGCSGFKYELAFDNETDDEDVIDSIVKNDETIKIIIDQFSLMYLDNVTLDYEINNLAEGFKFDGGSANRKTCACGSSFSG